MPILLLEVQIQLSYPKGKVLEGTLSVSLHTGIKDITHNTELSNLVGIYTH